MADSSALLDPKLSGEFLGNKSVTLRVAPPALRFCIRATESGAKFLDSKLGFKLPRQPKGSVAKGSRMVFWLGPDEWLLIDESSSSPKESSKKETSKKTSQKILDLTSSSGLSAVDISHRQGAIIVEGIGAESLLGSGCPRDLSLASFGIGSCSRTVFGKSEIVLFRSSQNVFRIECWRSYMDYVWTYLCEASRDIDV